MNSPIAKIIGEAPDWHIYLEDEFALWLHIERGEATLTDLRSRRVVSVLWHRDLLGPTTWKDAAHCLARMGYVFGRKLQVRSEA